MSLIPTTLALDADGDLDTLTGVRTTATLSEYVANLAGARLRFFLGEWFLDTRLGIPYFRDIFVKSPDMAAIRRIYSRTLLSVPGVVEVKDLRFTLDNQRRLFVSWRVLLSDGSEIATPQPFIVGDT